jgi:V/A-type H+/Na+-transporting ATPase subunit K
MTGLVWAFLGAALAIALAGLGSSIGTGLVGVASAGLTSREPEKFSKTLVLEALPGSQCIYGFVMAFLVLGKVTAGGSLMNFDQATGIAIFMACVPIAVVGFSSAVYQGMVAASSINILAKAGDAHLSKGIIYAVMVETFALIGLVISILLLTSIQVEPAAAEAVGQMMSVIG